MPATRPLGSAPFSVPPLALGCWGFADAKMWGPLDEPGAVATIRAALDHGITLLDTAPLYGAGLSEQLVGRAIAGRRDQALIATKVNEADFSAAGVRRSLDESLQRLATDHVDLLQIHWVGDERHFEDVIATFEALRDAGKVRACGVCNFGPAHLARLARTARGWVSNQLPYNLLWRAIEAEIAPRCREAGLGLLAYSPLLQGLLTGKVRRADDVPPERARTRHFRGDRPLSRHGGPGHEAETFAVIDGLVALADRLGHPPAHVAIAWILAQPGVSSVIVGARTPAHVVDNVRALDVRLGPAELAELDALTRGLKEKLGPDPDLWAPQSRYR